MADQVRVFVSHHHSPEEDTFTARLVADLEAAGADVWVDTAGITSDDFVKKISEGLTGRQWLVLVMTPDALKSPWVQREVNVAINEHSAGRMLGVLPIVMQPCQDQDIPMLWRTLHRHDATSGYETARDGLLRALALALPSAPPDKIVYSNLPGQQSVPLRQQPSNMPPIEYGIASLTPRHTLGTTALPPAGSQSVQLPEDRLPARLRQLGFALMHNNDGIEYILPPVCDVPAGRFLMGSDPNKDNDAKKDELPQHWVTLHAYQIGKHPVTVAEYACFVRATGRAVRTGEDSSTWVSWQTQLRERLDHPVVMVTWYDAMAYAQWLAERTEQPWRLPTEAEWEKAARWDAATGSARLFPWGDTFDEWRCNAYAEHYFMQGDESQFRVGTEVPTMPVGSNQDGASPCGAQDMAGNVWDWTSSLQKPYPYVANDGREQAESTAWRVIRGGSFLEYPRHARAAHRGSLSPGYAEIYMGFRLVLAVPSP